MRLTDEECIIYLDLCMAGMTGMVDGGSMNTLRLKWIHTYTSVLNNWVKRCLLSGDWTSRIPFIIMSRNKLMNESIDGRSAGWMYVWRRRWMCVFSLSISITIIIEFIPSTEWTDSHRLHDKLFGSLKFNSFEKYLSTLDLIHGKSLIWMRSSNDSQKEKSLFTASFPSRHFARLIFWDNNKPFTVRCNPWLRNEHEERGRKKRILHLNSKRIS